MVLKAKSWRNDVGAGGAAAGDNHDGAEAKASSHQPHLITVHVFFGFYPVTITCTCPTCPFAVALTERQAVKAKRWRKDVGAGGAAAAAGDNHDGAGAESKAWRSHCPCFLVFTGSRLAGRDFERASYLLFSCESGFMILTSGVCKIPKDPSLKALESCS